MIQTVCSPFPALTVPVSCGRQVSVPDGEGGGVRRGVHPEVPGGEAAAGQAAAPPRGQVLLRPRLLPPGLVPGRSVGQPRGISVRVGKGVWSGRLSGSGDWDSSVGGASDWLEKLGGAILTRVGVENATQKVNVAEANGYAATRLWGQQNGTISLRSVRTPWIDIQINLDVHHDWLGLLPAVAEGAEIAQWVLAYWHISKDRL